MTNSSDFHKRLEQPWEEDRMDSFLSLIEERQRIWEAKEVQKKDPPWTDNEILQKAKFTNVYRELDRVSRFELENCISDDPLSCLEKILVLRHTNSPDIFRLLYENCSVEDLELLQRENNRNFVSDAIMFVPPLGHTRASWVLEYFRIIKRESERVLSLIQNSPSADTVLEIIRSNFPRMGYFGAYEVYTSLTYCSWFPWTEDDAVVCGPGVPPTLVWLLYPELDLDDCFDYHSHRLISGSEGVLKYFAEEVRNRLISRGNMVWIPESWQPCKKYDQKFTLRCMEHQSCENRKYLGILRTGRVRRKYQSKVKV